ncbi:hypothetical protein HA466_0316660 [Hirschfeldia incana]|nr:hypothetical protein HA466_0316660 [Hirschfeldia incana]
MVKMMWVSVNLLLVAALLLVTMEKIPVAEGVTCSVTELYPCLAGVYVIFATVGVVLCQAERAEAMPLWVHEEP